MAGDHSSERVSQQVELVPVLAKLAHLSPPVNRVKVIIHRAFIALKLQSGGPSRATQAKHINHSDVKVWPQVIDHLEELATPGHVAVNQHEGGKPFSFTSDIYLMHVVLSVVSIVKSHIPYLYRILGDPV